MPGETRTGLEGEWSGVVLKDKKTAAAFSDAFWHIAKEEAESLCRTREGAQNLARLTLYEMRREYAARPLPKDPATEVIVNTCMLFGKWGYDEKQLEERVARARAENTLSGSQRPEEREPVWADAQERSKSGPIREAEESPGSSPRPATREPAEAQRLSFGRSLQRKPAAQSRGAAAVPQAAPAAEQPFPRLYETPQIQINFMSPDWQGQKPVVQYVYPQNPPARPARSEPDVWRQEAAAWQNPPAPRDREAFRQGAGGGGTVRQSAVSDLAAEPLTASDPDPIPAAPEASPEKPDGKEKAGLTRREKRPKTEKQDRETGSRLLMGSMIAAAVAAAAALVFLVWQVFFAR